MGQGMGGHSAASSCADGCMFVGVHHTYGGTTVRIKQDDEALVRLTASLDVSSKHTV